MRRADLVPDCARCAAICCVAPSFDESEDFAIDKPAGVRCPYLRRDDRCAIHAERVVRGFQGCAIYDCYGAGQRATRAFAGTRNTDAQRNEAFLVLRVVHELLWLLAEAAKLRLAPELATKLSAQIELLDKIAQLPATELVELDLRPHSHAARSLLRRVGDALGGCRRTARSLIVVD